MRNNLEMKKQSGFTLIEIAIVMVIIGLLVGGVLKGQGLIDNAKIKSVVKDMQGMQAAWYGYYDRKRVYGGAQTDYIASNGSSDFWFGARTEGLLTGQAASLVPGTNALGGFMGIVSSSAYTTFSGPAVCTSVPSKFAQGIDATLDDGFSSLGVVHAIQGTTNLLNETIAGSTPLTGAYSSAGYVILCMEL